VGSEIVSRVPRILRALELKTGGEKALAEAHPGPVTVPPMDRENAFTALEVEEMFEDGRDPLTLFRELGRPFQVMTPGGQ
jgi:hypothetical protein